MLYTTETAESVRRNLQRQRAGSRLSLPQMRSKKTAIVLRGGNAKIKFTKRAIRLIFTWTSKSQIFCRHTNLYGMLDEYEIPYVFIQGVYSQMLDKPHILMDDCKGGYMVTKHLLDYGHKKILGIFKADDSQGRNRKKI